MLDTALCCCFDTALRCVFPISMYSLVDETAEKLQTVCAVSDTGAIDSPSFLLTAVEGCRERQTIKKIYHHRRRCLPILRSF